MTGEDHAGDPGDEVGHLGGHRGTEPPGGGDGRRHRDLVEAGERGVDGGVVALDDHVPELGVGGGDRGLDGGDRPVDGKHAAEGEEAGLQDGVHPATQSHLAGDAGGVDGVDRDVEVDDPLLGLARDAVPHLVCRVRAVEQEGGAVVCPLQDVELLQQAELVAGDELGLLDQVRGADGSGPNLRWETVTAPDFFES